MIAIPRHDLRIGLKPSTTPMLSGARSFYSSISNYVQDAASNGEDDTDVDYDHHTDQLLYYLRVTDFHAMANGRLRGAGAKEIWIVTRPLEEIEKMRILESSAPLGTQIHAGTEGEHFEGRMG